MLEAERDQYSEPRHTRELTFRRQSTVSASIYRYRPRGWVRPFAANVAVGESRAYLHTAGPLLFTSI